MTDTFIKAIDNINSFREVKVDENGIEFVFLATLYKITKNEDNNYNIKLYTQRMPNCVSMESLKLYERDLFTVIRRLGKTIKGMLESDQIVIAVGLEDNRFTLEALSVLDR